MFQREDSAIAGVVRLIPHIAGDVRGSFVKTFHEAEFRRLGLCSRFPEQYYSWSRKDVLRGMHFQAPPHAHAKLVTCLVGRVLDAVVDLRTASPTYGKAVTFDLAAETAAAIYIPVGCAHGFHVLSSRALLHYSVGSVHAPEADAGILWSSVGVTWQTSSPIMSDRDQVFPRLPDFRSPFR